jgi:hypothetical protein
MHMAATYCQGRNVGTHVSTISGASWQVDQQWMQLLNCLELKFQCVLNLQCCSHLSHHTPS